MLWDTYELPVGTPPVIEVKCEETTLNICVSGDGSEAGKSPRPDALGADNLGSDDTLVEAISSNPKMERRKCAYTRAYTRLFSSPAPISRPSSPCSDSRHSSLSPTSTPARSPSPLFCYPLFLPSSNADLDTACGTEESMPLENADDELWSGGIILTARLFFSASTFTPYLHTQRIHPSLMASLKRCTKHSSKRRHHSLPAHVLIFQSSICRQRKPSTPPLNYLIR